MTFFPTCVPSGVHILTQSHIMLLELLGLTLAYEGQLIVGSSTDIALSILLFLLLAVLCSILTIHFIVFVRVKVRERQRKKRLIALEEFKKQEEKKAIEAKGLMVTPAKEASSLFFPTASFNRTSIELPVITHSATAFSFINSLVATAAPTTDGAAVTQPAVVCETIIPHGGFVSAPPTSRASSE